MYRLPWPAAGVNHQYIHTRHNTRLTKEAQAWRDLAIVYIRANRQPVPEGALRVYLLAHPPDNRRRDLDNLLKPVLDSLALALDFDDARITHIEAEMGEPSKVWPRIEITLSGGKQTC